MKKLPEPRKAVVQKFIADPANRLLLAQWMMAHSEAASAKAYEDARKAQEKEVRKVEKDCANRAKQIETAKGVAKEALKFRLENRQFDLEELQADAQSPRTMAEAYKVNGGAAKLLEQVTGNLDWMEQILYTGETAQPGRALAILATVAEKYPKLAYKVKEREIATATAVEWAKSGWLFPRAIDRACFYIDNWKEGRLNEVFDDLPFWQRRMVCGCKGHDTFGSLESLQWALDNVHLPADRYPGACWQCAYRLHNLFGESIHGSSYYAPYDGRYGRNRLRQTYEIGGVCGGLSHFGAFSALANGVPAMTAGEPGHCAFIVLVNGKWTPAYSLSWQRGLHWQVWKNIHKYSSLHMATQLYSDDKEQVKATRLSNALQTLGEMFASQKENDKALACFQEAVKAQPLNFPAWRAEAQFLTAAKPQDAAAWKNLHDTLCKTLVPTYPEMAAEILQQHAYPGMFRALNKEEKLACHNAFWSAVNEMGPDRWDIEGLCNRQADSISDKGKDNDETRLGLYVKILTNTAGKAKYAPVILSWGNTLAAKMKPEMQKKLMKSTVTALGSGTGKMDADSRDKMLGQALQGAEQMRDISTFQAIGKLLSAKYRQPKSKMPKWEPFPGKLASQGGLLFTSSTCKHDEPPAHWGVLEPVGGRFHTGNDMDAWAAVKLPKPVFVTGVVVVTTGDNMWRLNDLKVQYSETGNANDWHDAGQFFQGACKQRVNRLDLRSSKPRASYIRILRPGGKQFFHLNGIYVYGEQAA